MWLNFRKHQLILFTVFSKLQRGVYISRFMEQNKHLHNKIMKLTFLALCIFALQINLNLADVIIDCLQGQKCNVFGRDYGKCGKGYCLNRPDDPNLTCHCPYVPPKPKPAICKQGQECGKPFSKRNAEICGNGECIWDCTSHPCVIMSNQKFVSFFMNFNTLL